MKKKNVTVPLPLIIDSNLSSSAKVVYVVLKSFPPTAAGQPFAARPQPFASKTSESAVVAAHQEIARRSRLSANTIVKALRKLEAAGWIVRERRLGAANRYVFSEPTAGGGSAFD